MAALGAQTVAASYEQLLHVDTDGGGNGNNLLSIKDGDNGTTFGLKLATNKVEVIPGSNDANAFEVSQADGTAVFTVNTSTAGATLTGTLGVTGTSTLTGDVSIVSASSASPTLLVKNTNDDGEPAYMQFIKDTSNSAADNDEIVKMEFYHDNDANSLVRYGAMIVSTPDVSNGSEDTKIKFMTRAAGTDTETMSLVSGHVEIPDNAKFRVGTGQDMSYYHTGTDSYLQNTTGHLYLHNNAASKFIHILQEGASGGITLSTNNTERVRVVDDGRVAIKATTLPHDFGGERGHLCISSTDNAGANNYAILQMQGHSINNDGILGAIHFYDHSSSNCSIQANRQNNSGSGKLLFATSPSGGSKVTRLTIYDGGVAELIADHSSAYAWNVQNDGNDTDRYGMHIICGKDDGSGTNTAIRFSDGDNTEVGKITFSGGTVTYGAFTAHHPCTIPDADNNSESGENAYPYGTLLETTSLSYTQKNGADTERGIRYNVRKSQSANSKTVLGAYGSCMNSKETHAEGDVIAQTENLHQALVLGDGHIICNNEGGNIKIGDGICTSSTEGIGMKATASPSMVIGIAQEDVSFSGSETKLVAVQYGLQQFTPW